MVVTPNSAQPPTQFAGAGLENPAVLNLRRPGVPLAKPPTAPPTAPYTGIANGPDANVVLATAVDEDNALPPTVLRLPHLGAALSQIPSRWQSIASIAHWVAIVLGALIAMWMIFSGRAKPLEDAPPSSSAPARADATPDWKAPALPSAGQSSAPSWNPPLSSAGESSAPKWTPPMAAPAPTQDAPAPTQDTTEAALPAYESQPAPADEMPAHETWPKSEAPEPASSQLEFPAAPETTARYEPIGANPGPAYRTAQREAPLADPYQPAADADAQPLGITVPVPQ